MPDPIPGEWLSAATLAIESQPTGTPAAQVATVVLEAVVPLIRATAMEGSATQWGLRLTGESGEPIFDAYPSEEAARYALPGFQGVFDTVVIRRQVGPWAVVPDGEAPAAAVVCRHCGEEIVPCPHATPGSYCLGWIHPAYAHYGPIGPHYCGGRSVNPSAEPAIEEEGGHG